MGRRHVTRRKAVLTLMMSLRDQRFLRCRLVLTPQRVPGSCCHSVLSQLPGGARYAAAELRPRVSYRGPRRRPAQKLSRLDVSSSYLPSLAVAASPASTALHLFSDPLHTEAHTQNRDIPKLMFQTSLAAGGGGSAAVEAASFAGIFPAMQRQGQHSSPT